MPRVVHFEIQADDMERAKTFYENVFGWQFQQYQQPWEYWIIITGPDEQPGINGGLLKREGERGSGELTAFPCTIDVDNLDAYVEKVTSAGGQIAKPKMHIPTVGWLAYALDTEGNTFGMMQYERGQEEKRES